MATVQVATTNMHCDTQSIRGKPPQQTTETTLGCLQASSSLCTDHCKSLYTSKQSVHYFTFLDVSCPPQTEETKQIQGRSSFHQCKLGLFNETGKQKNNNFLMQENDYHMITVDNFFD